MIRIVLVNTDFCDRHTKKIHKAGDTLKMSDDRITEVRSVNPDFVTVIGTVEEAKPETAPEDAKEAKAAKDKKNPEEVPQE